MPKLWWPVGTLPVVLLAGCTAFQSSDVNTKTNATGQTHSVLTEDNSVIAQKVGLAPSGLFSPIPWANPGTGSAGVIESISTDGGVNPGCRAFITSRQRLSGTDRVRGVACQNDPKRWTIDILG